jgi:alpha-glucosidase
MYFGRIAHPDNFTFSTGMDGQGGLIVDAGHLYEPSLTAIGADVFRLRIHRQGEKAWRNPSQAELAESLDGATSCKAFFDDSASFRLTDGAVDFVRGVPSATFGVSGDAWMLQFALEGDEQFYGLGENCNGFDKAGRRAKFWNTDVWADYPLSEAFNGNPAALYVSIPWVIVKRENCYLGILVNHPGAVFMDLGSNFIWDVKNADDKARGSFYIGAPDGEVDVYFLVGPSLSALTRKMQTLVGRTPLPPLWALGYHQCRWGYAGPEDLLELDRQFTQYGIPADGLWLDIDYMDHYKVFTFDAALWGDEGETKDTLASLRAKGRRVVPILDPGVKKETGYSVYVEGVAKDVFCHNREGKPFVGFVWPGKTSMPDFSLPDVREWWAGKVRDFALTGPSGAWLDMNDPSVGAVEPGDMLFERGNAPHESYHNQYALGMAQASRAGFLAARPDERPFLLSRSACISSSRHTAVWTGDNYSNWHQLRLAIPVSLGLALSGIPFNGPDVPGFGGEATPELALAWYKCGFLFPFFRNHSACDTPRKEPWMFGRKTCEIIAHYIRLRYKLLPYLYNLWIAQEERGDAVMRPLFHECSDSPELPLGGIADQFFMGPSIMQAPVLTEGASSRDVLLPQFSDGARWFSAMDGKWYAGGAHCHCKTRSASTPLFVREGAVLPMQTGVRTRQANDLASIELHCFFRPDTAFRTRYEYAFDDGESFAYREGRRTRAVIEVHVEAGELVVEVAEYGEGYKPLAFSIVAYGGFRGARVITAKGTVGVPLHRHTWVFTGKALRCESSEPVRIWERGCVMPQPDYQRSLGTADS